MTCNQILDNLDYYVELLEDDQRLFLQNRDKLETESRKLEDLRPIFMNFNGLYDRFVGNVVDIVTARSDLKDIERMHKRGEIQANDYLMKTRQLKTTIVDSCMTITQDIFPKLRKLANEISIDSASEENKTSFDNYRDDNIKIIEKEIEGKGVIEKVKPYLSKLFPILIKKAAAYATGIPL